MYKLIAFDVDGTLIDSKENCLTALHNLLLHETGISHSLKELEYAFGYSGKQVMDDFHLPHSRIDDWVEEEIKLAYMAHPYSGINELLDTLKQQHYLLGIATSKYQKELNPFLEVHGLLKYFDYKVCFDNITYMKPHPESLNILSAMSGIAKTNMLFIGDSNSDLNCAKNAGVDFALAGWGSSGKMKTLCENILISPGDLLKILSPPGYDSH